MKKLYFPSLHTIRVIVRVKKWSRGILYQIKLWAGTALSFDTCTYEGEEMLL